MQSILCSVKIYSRKLEIDFDEISGATVLRTGFALRECKVNGFILVNEERRQVSFVTVCPLTIQKDHRQATAELILRINSNLFLGRFDLDMDDGEVRYHSSVMLGDGDLDEEMYSHLIFTNLIAMDIHFSAIAAVSIGSESPVTAIEHAKCRVISAAFEGNEDRGRKRPGRFGLFDPSNN
jgi:hypothetical protein